MDLPFDPTLFNFFVVSWSIALLAGFVIGIVVGPVEGESEEGPPKSPLEAIAYWQSVDRKTEKDRLVASIKKKRQDEPSTPGPEMRTIGDGSAAFEVPAILGAWRLERLARSTYVDSWDGEECARWSGSLFREDATAQMTVAESEWFWDMYRNRRAEAREVCEDIGGLDRVAVSGLSGLRSADEPGLILFESPYLGWNRAGLFRQGAFVVVIVGGAWAVQDVAAELARVLPASTAEASATGSPARSAADPTEPRTGQPGSGTASAPMR